jgi:hypothetical protein
VDRIGGRKRKRTARAIAPWRARSCRSEAARVRRAGVEDVVDQTRSGRLRRHVPLRASRAPGPQSESARNRFVPRRVRSQAPTRRGWLVWRNGRRAAIRKAPCLALALEKDRRRGRRRGEKEDRDSQREGVREQLRGPVWQRPNSGWTAGHGIAREHRAR